MVFVLGLLPYVLFGAPGGVLADRLDRRKLLVGLDIGRGLVMLVLVGVVTADGPVVLGAVLCAVTSSFSAVTRPAIVAATPRVVGEEDLAAADALETVIAQLTVFVGPALATLLIEVASIEVALALQRGDVRGVRGAHDRRALRRRRACRPGRGCGPVDRRGRW